MANRIPPEDIPPEYGPNRIPDEDIPPELAENSPKEGITAPLAPLPEQPLSYADMIRQSLTGEVLEMYQADIARGADPEYALSRALSTLAGQMQTRGVMG